MKEKQYVYISKKLDLYLFADDTNIYYEDQSLVNLEKKVNKELKNLYLWLNVNRLALNIEKTNFVIFHPFNKPLKYNVTIKIHKNAIIEKQSIKYLGILIDSTLSWKDHITNLSKKITINRNNVQIKTICQLKNYEKCIPCFILFSPGLWYTSMGLSL